MVALPSTALAQAIEPTDAQYKPVSEQIDQGPGTLTEAQSGNPSSPPAAEPDRPVAGLPFTGLDAGLLLAVAVVLAGSGLALRRLSGASARD